MSIGSYTLILNEAEWIAPCILRVLPFIDEMVYYDGGSRDGTVEIIRAIQKEHKDGGKIKLFFNKTPKNLQDDYTKLSNECLHELSTDFAMFLHPDMFVSNPEQFMKCKDNAAFAMSCKMRSFAGDPGGQLYEIKGRGEAWKNITRIRNPEMGAHYFGWYGAYNEDVYLSEITGEEHNIYDDFTKYPYLIDDSGIEILHFSDVRPYKRRLERMRRCLLNQGRNPDTVDALAKSHPRVSLENGAGFVFTPTTYPEDFMLLDGKYEDLRRDLVAG